jgi:hypothetical protein
MRRIVYRAFKQRPFVNLKKEKKMKPLSKRQKRVLRVLRQSELKLRQRPKSAVWAIEIPWNNQMDIWTSTLDRLVRIKLKAKEVSDLSALGLLCTQKDWDGKSYYTLSVAR